MATKDFIKQRNKDMRRYKSFYQAHNQYKGDTNMNLKTIRKALVAPGVALAIWLLSLIGVTPTPELEVQIGLIVVGILTYLIPNEG